jgi:hypothetical protein
MYWRWLENIRLGPARLNVFSVVTPLTPLLQASGCEAAVLQLAVELYYRPQALAVSPQTTAGTGASAHLVAIGGPNGVAVYCVVPSAEPVALRRAELRECDSLVNEDYGAAALGFGLGAPLCPVGIPTLPNCTSPHYILLHCTLCTATCSVHVPLYRLHRVCSSFHCPLRHCLQGSWLRPRLLCLPLWCCCTVRASPLPYPPPQTLHACSLWLW